MPLTARNSPALPEGETAVPPALQPLKGRRGGKDQNRSGQKGQRTGKVQKQHRPHASAQQGGDPSCPWPTGRHAPQGKGRVIPRRLGGGQRRRQKKSDAPGQQLCRLVPAPYHVPVPHSLSLLYSAVKSTASLVFSTILQAVWKKSRREKKAAPFPGWMPIVDFYGRIWYDKLSCFHWKGRPALNIGTLTINSSLALAPMGRGHGCRLPPDLRGIGGGIYHHGAHLLQGPVLPRQEDPVPAPAVSRGAPCGSADLRQ